MVVDPMGCSLLKKKRKLSKDVEEGGEKSVGAACERAETVVVVEGAEMGIRWQPHCQYNV
jgi:hypothetical protein